MMKKIIYIAVAVMLTACGSSKTASLSTDSTVNLSTDTKLKVTSTQVTADSILANMAKASFRSSELLVKFKSGTSSSTMSSVNGAVGVNVIKAFPRVPNLQHVKLPPGMSVQDAVVRYMSNSSVEFAEPNYLRSVNAAPTPVTPNDTFFTPQQWALYNTGNYASGFAGADIKAREAWSITKGSRDVVVAVLDTGVDFTHPDLVNNLWTNTAETQNNLKDDDKNLFVDDWRGWNFVYDDLNANGVCDQNPEDPTLDEGCNYPMDLEGHGTHVAGIIGAATNNGTGIAGIMWNVRIMPVKVCGLDGCPVDAIVSGLGYASQMGAKIVNMSLGGYAFSSAEEQAIIDANSRGVIVVASSGNDGYDNDIQPHYPSGYYLPNIISVASTDQNDRRSDFSNFGPRTVHVAAPGTYILSTVIRDGAGGPWYSTFCTGAYAEGYDICSGTSMAAPHVSGLAGLLASYYGSALDMYRIRGMILRYVDPLSTLTGWIWNGGRINAYNAISSLLTPTGLNFDWSSSRLTLSWTDNATGEDGYVIERSTAGGSFARIATVGRDATSYTDTTAASGTAYTYRVKAYSMVTSYPSTGSLEALALPAEISTNGSGSSGGTTDDHDGGGGGCSIGPRRDMSAASADALVMMTPLLVIIALRGMRRRKK